MFEWDEAKNRANIAKHGVDFDVAKRIFDGEVLTRIDARKAYGEVRQVSIGKVDGMMVLAVVHTDRNGGIRIISARFADRDERKSYEKEIRPPTHH